jgi:hypothetical protein
VTFLKTYVKAAGGIKFSYLSRASEVGLKVNFSLNNNSKNSDSKRKSQEKLSN